MLINKEHLNQFNTKGEVLFSAKIYNILAGSFNKEKKGVTVFLSHKHNETEVLKQAVVLLRSLGAEVYLDWLDDDMPIETNGETAIKIKSKIKENKKFILLATNEAIASRWCNWELGYGDAHKFENHIAIMPIADKDGSWQGSEYLQIYPSITTEYQTIKGNYYVEFKNKKTRLNDWLNS